MTTWPRREAAAIGERDQRFIRQVEELERCPPGPRVAVPMTEDETLAMALYLGALWHPLVVSHLKADGIELVGVGKDPVTGRFRPAFGGRGGRPEHRPMTTKRLVRRLWLAGTPTPTIADSCAVSKGAVWCWTRDLPQRYPRINEDKLTRLEQGDMTIEPDSPKPPTKKERIIALYNEGHSARTMARMLGVTVTAIYNHLRGVPKRGVPAAKGKVAS